MIKNMVQNYKKEKIAPKILTAFLTEKNVQGGEYIGPNLGKYLDHKDIENLALVSNSTYQNLKPLNTLLTQLKKVAHAVPKSSLAEVNVGQKYQSTHAQHNI